MPLSNTKRKTIGFLTRSLPHQSGLSAWRGIVERANTLGVNLVTFFAEAIGDERDFNYQANILYDMLSTDRLDGLVVWTAMIDLYVSKAELDIFFKRFEKFPVVSAEVVIPGVNSVVMDDYSGMREIVEHLVHHHRYQKIAFLRGPDGHIGLQDRFRAYKDVLRESGIAQEEHLISKPCNFYIEDAARAVKSLMNEQTWSDAQAIVAPSESLALGAMLGLQQLGKTIPGEIALVCFDDTESVELAKPPISTVYAPLFEIVSGCIDVLLRQMGGDRGVQTTYVPTKMVIRQSCGCKSTVSSMLEIPHRLPSPSAGASTAPVVLGRHIDDLTSTVALLWTGHHLAPWSSDLSRTFLGALEQASSGAAAQYLQTLEKIIEHLEFTNNNLDDVGRIVHSLWCFADVQFAQTNVSVRNAFLYNEAGKLLVIAAQRATINALASNKHHTENESRKMQALGNLLVTAASKEVLFDLLTDSFVDLGVQKCFVAIYESQNATMAQLELAYIDGERLPVHDLPAFPCPLLVPDSIYGLMPEVNVLVQSLHFRDNKIGYLILNSGTLQDGAPEILRSMISSALQTEILREIIRCSLLDLRAAQDQLIISEKMAVLGGLVTGVAHELNTPLGVGITTASSMEHIIKEMGAKLESRELSFRAFSQWIAALGQGTALISSSLARASKFVGDFKQISTDQTTDAIRTINVDSYLNEIIGTLGSEISSIGHRIEVRCDKDLQILSYPGAIAQVLTHLILNSLKHGLVDTVHGIIRIQVTRNQQMVSIDYSDNGKGVSAKELPHIFVPFRTSLRNTGGSGLGTYVIYNLVTQKLKGTVTATSDVGCGLCYQIALPSDIT